MAGTKIKICGITSAKDAAECLKAGADYLGFNFFPRSPRYIEPRRVKGILDALRKQGFDRVSGVGVFVDAPSEDIRRTLALCGLRIVQLHGSETPEDVAELEGLHRIKAIKMKGKSSLASLEDYGAEAYLVDSPSGASPGGTGLPYDYSLAVEAAARHRLFLAGGLGPETVAQAIRTVRPYGVDVASGVETCPGVKDLDKVRAFCQAARGALRG